MISPERLAEYWLLLPEEKRLLANRTAHGRLGIALLLKFFQEKGRFPANREEIPEAVVEYVARQIGVSTKAWPDLEWEGPTIKRLRAEIREWLGFREATVADTEALETWLVDEAMNHEHRMDRLREIILDRCRALHIEPPTQEQIRRLLRSALQEHETRFCADIFRRLDSVMLERLDAFLRFCDEDSTTMWQNLKADPGKAGLQSVKEAALRLNLVRKVGLPADL